jgi:O-6-methylguanine DNA methyltransferase
VNVNTALGTFAVRWSARGVTGLEFARRPGASALRHRLAIQLQRYAEGQRVRWSVPLDLSEGTAFQRKVWRILQQIPYGQTRSYAWVARRMGKPKAARAVGAACGANPIPVIIPCHRVVASDGSLGGYSAGLAWKRKLLRVEGVGV